MSFKQIPLGSIEKCNVIIEIPTGSSVKYEYDEKLDNMKLDWIFENNFCFPYNYGFIPKTRGGDGDMLDAFVITTYPLGIGTIAESRPIGIIKLLDRGEQDDKIICVASADPTYKSCNELRDLPFDYQKLFNDFFIELGRQKNKHMEIQGYESTAQAKRMIQESHTKF